MIVKGLAVAVKLRCYGLGLTGLGDMTPKP